MASSVDGSPESGSRLTVVTVTYDSADDVRAFLAAVHAASEDVVAEVIVSDNASADETVHLLRDLDGVTVVARESNDGYAAGINSALERAPDDVPVLIANPDVRPMPGSLVGLLTAARRPGVGIVVPRLEDDTGRLLPSLRREPTVVSAVAEALLGGRLASRLALGELVRRPASYGRSTTVDWATGAALLVTAECRRAVGRWDETFFLYSEETDYMLRARDAGFRTVIEPAAVVRHRGGAAHVDPRLWSLLSRNRVRLYARRHGRLSTRLFWAAVVLHQIVRLPVARRPTYRRALRDLLAEHQTLIDGSQS